MIEKECNGVIRKFVQLFREHLDFLQCMVGYDASLHELVDLIDSQRAAATEYLN